MAFCETCFKDYSIEISRRQGKVFQKSDEIYSEKLSCGCGELVYYNNVFPNWVFYPKPKSFIDELALDMARGINLIRGVKSE